MDTSELERYILLRVLAAATKVCEWDWEDNDPEPQRAIEQLKKSVEEAKQFQKLRNDAENAQKAAMYQNAARG